VIRLTKTQLQPIGVDIGFDSIKMMQLEASSDTLSVHCAARVPIPADGRDAGALRLPAIVDLVRQMFRQNPFSGRRIVTALPREIVHVKNLRLPMMPVAEITSAIEFEARSIFPFDTERAQVRFLHAGEVRQGADVKQEVVVLASRNEDVDNFLEQINRCGAGVESLDWEPAAIYRGVERFIRRREDEHEVHVLVDVGLRCSQVIIGKGHEISFYKPIDVGGQKFNEAVSRKLGISLEEASALRRRLAETPVGAEDAEKRDPVRHAVGDATRSIMEELAREISLCLRYYSVTFRGQRPNRVRLVGGEANDPQLLLILNTTLPIPSETGKPLQNVNLGRLKPADRRGSLSEWSVALGLAMKLTTGRYGSREGTGRDAGAVRGDTPLAPQGEVVDLNSAINRNAPVSSAPVSTDKPKPEAVHA
jgi:type IV pilus assembly protein PilM